MLLSVIIPTHNRPERLRECLNALACQSQTGVDFEVLVVDDGSEPSMEPTVRSVQGLVIHYIRKPQGGPASARNLGASEAGGRYLVFLDDDCQPPRDWLGRIAEAVEANPGAILGGRTVNKLSGNKYSSASQLLVDFLYHYYQGADEGRFFTSNNLIVPKQDFEALGGFDEGFRRAAAEDREFGYRWIAEGRPLVFLPTILLYHSHQLSLPSFLRQHFNYGRGALRYWKLRSQRGREVDLGRARPILFQTGDLPLHHCRAESAAAALNGFFDVCDPASERHGLLLGACQIKAFGQRS